MTKIKLVDGTIIDASSVELVSGTLKITTTEKTVEELAEIFKNKDNVNLITLLTGSGKESGYKTGFTSFGGIMYNEDDSKTVELFQPVDVTEARLSNVEGNTNLVNEKTVMLEEQNAALSAQNEVLAEQNEVIAATLDSLLTDVIPTLMVEE